MRKHSKIFENFAKRSPDCDFDEPDTLYILSLTSHDVHFLP